MLIIDSTAFLCPAATRNDASLVTCEASFVATCSRSDLAEHPSNEESPCRHPRKAFAKINLWKDNDILSKSVTTYGTRAQFISFLAQGNLNIFLSLLFNLLHLLPCPNGEMLLHLAKDLLLNGHVRRQDFDLLVLSLPSRNLVPQLPILRCSSRSALTLVDVA